MKKVIVLHNVAVNGGDQLLLEALSLGLQKYCNAKITLVTTNNYNSFPFIPYRTILNDFFLLKSDLSYRLEPFCESKVSRYILSKFVRFCKSISKNYQEVEQIILNSDFVILGPGGFLHEYYNYMNLSGVIEYFTSLNKPLYILGQSIGPFKKSKATAKKLLGHFDKIFLREKSSLSFIQDLKDPDLTGKCLVTSDIALGYPPYRVELIGRKKVFLNFRDWIPKGRDAVLDKGVRILEVLLKNGYSVEFISTCQGVEQYTNDSEIHEVIVERCKEKFRHSDNVYINKAKYTPSNLIQYLATHGKYSIVMRLHMAISSLLAGLPVLNFGYEPKNIGVFDTIGLRKYAHNLFSDQDEVESIVEAFLGANFSQLEYEVNVAIEEGQQLFEQTFTALNEVYIEAAST